jgi:hypothetical protein
MESEQRLEWTKVGTGENIHSESDFNKIKHKRDYISEQ